MRLFQNLFAEKIVVSQLKFCLLIFSATHFIHHKVMSFGTKSEVDEWLLNNPLSCPGALHFVERNATIISYGLPTNSTPVAVRVLFEDPTFKFQIPFQIDAEREIARSFIGDPNFSWDVGLTEFAHPFGELYILQNYLETYSFDDLMVNLGREA